MAHWAKLDVNNIVENIIVTSNDEPDEGASWIAENLEGFWLQTSYNTRKNVHALGGIPFRKNFAQLGYFYNEAIDGFVPPKEQGQEDFVLDEELGIWVPPVAPPSDYDFIVQYGPDFTEADLLADSKVYFWIADKAVWGMYPNSSYPKPEGNYAWEPVDKVWVAFVPQVTDELE